MAEAVHRFTTWSTHNRPRRATCAYEGCPHNPQDLLLLLFFSLLVINKEKTGAASWSTDGASGTHEKGGARVERSVRTLYGDEQRLLRIRGDLRICAAPRVWKGLS